MASTSEVCRSSIAVTPRTRRVGPGTSRTSRLTIFGNSVLPCGDKGRVVYDRQRRRGPARGGHRLRRFGTAAGRADIVKNFGIESALPPRPSSPSSMHRTRTRTRSISRMFRGATFVTWWDTARTRHEEDTVRGRRSRGRACIRPCCSTLETLLDVAPGPDGKRLSVRSHNSRTSRACRRPCCTSRRSTRSSARPTSATTRLRLRPLDHF